MKKLFITMLLGVSILTVGCGKKDEGVVEVNSNSKTIESVSEKENEYTKDNKEVSNEEDIEVITIEEQLTYLQETVQSLTVENSDLLTKLSDYEYIKGQYETLQNDYMKLQSENENLQENYDEVNRDIDSYSNDYTNSRVEIEKLKSEIENLKQQLTSANLTIEELRNQLSNN